MKMKPMGDQILLKKKEGQETTKSGIILTSGTKNYEYADVIAVGPGIFTQTGDRIKMTCKVGNVVLLHSRLLKGDNEITLDDEQYVLVRESEISMVSNN
jgi:chaperonin GroES